MGRYAKFHSARSNPRGTRKKSFDAVLSRMISVIQDGERKELPAEQAFLLHLRNKSRSGDASASELLASCGDQIASLEMPAHPVVSVIRRSMVRAGSVSGVLELLRMAKKFDRYSAEAVLKLEPWIVQAALHRLGDRRLTPDEQRMVVAVTRTPHKVQWPDWWKVTDMTSAIEKDG